MSNKEVSAGCYGWSIEEGQCFIDFEKDSTTTLSEKEAEDTITKFEALMKEYQNKEPTITVTVPYKDFTIFALQNLQADIHEGNVKAGWWKDLETGQDFVEEVHKGTRFGKALVNEKLNLVVSEVSEATEGYRKNLQDDKLPTRSMLEVELADAIIRILDLGGALKLDIAGAIVEKLAYNAQREDHKIASRLGKNGKSF